MAPCRHVDASVVSRRVTSRGSRPLRIENGIARSAAGYRRFVARCGTVLRQRQRSSTDYRQDGGRPAPPVRQPDERRPRKRRAYWGTKAKPVGSRADGFAVLGLGIQFFDRPGRRETTRAKSYVIVCFPTRASNANPHPARCGFAACCRLRVWAGFDRNCRRPRRMPVMSYSPQPLPRQA